MNFQNDVLRMIDTLAKVKIGKDISSSSEKVAEISKNISTTPKLSTGSDVLKAYDELSEQEKLEFEATKGQRLQEGKEKLKQKIKNKQSININDDIKNIAQSHAIKSVDNDRFMRKFKGDENK